MGKRDYVPPQWAIKTAQPGDRDAAARAHRRGALKTNWEAFRVSWYRPDSDYVGEQKIDGPPKAWAKAQGWPTPWFSFKEAFLAKMLESDENFDLAVTRSGVKVYFPKEEEHVLSEKDLKHLDAMYKKRDGGRPTQWDRLVDELREIRRAVEAGVVVRVEGEALEDYNTFYTWAHGRYHALEDGCDSWIGHDEP